jgi:hypothetical protein
MDVVVGRGAAFVAAGLALAVFAVLWWGVPLAQRRVAG